MKIAFSIQLFFFFSFKNNGITQDPDQNSMYLNPLLRPPVKCKYKFRSTMRGQIFWSEYNSTHKARRIAWTKPAGLVSPRRLLSVPTVSSPMALLLLPPQLWSIRQVSPGFLRTGVSCKLLSRLAAPATAVNQNFTHTKFWNITSIRDLEK